MGYTPVRISTIVLSHNSEASLPRIQIHTPISEVPTSRREYMARDSSRFRSSGSDLGSIAKLACAYAKLGKNDEAMKIIGQLKSLKRLILCS